jgi:hypothetical protein
VYFLELADVYEYGAGVGVLSGIEDVGIWGGCLLIVNSVVKGWVHIVFGKSSFRSYRSYLGGFFFLVPALQPYSCPHS